MISSDIARCLKPHIDFIPVCPEVEVGLGVPRQPIRVVEEGGTPRLVQPATGKDVSTSMRRFAKEYLRLLRDVDGFILKSRSPSCGIKDVKIFPNRKAPKSFERGVGFFAAEVLERFSLFPAEDEGRLTNFKLREHFLTALYTLVRFRLLKKSKRMKDLIAFHAENKFLLMATSQKELRILGRIVANHERRAIDEVMHRYEEHLRNTFIRPSRYTLNINVMMHALGYFSKELSHREKSFFLDSLEQYRAGKVPLSVCTAVIRSWIVRFEEPYLMQQTYFEPFPQPLIDISDSGKGRGRS